MTTGDKPLDHHRHALHWEEDHVTALSVTQRKAIFGQTVALHAPSKECGRHQRIGACFPLACNFSEFNIKNQC
jgi:hypothetical protein